MNATATATAPHHAINWYEYDPSYPTAVVAATLYSIVGSYTIFKFIQKRAWFWWPLVLGTVMEMVGYIARALSAKDTSNKDLYIIQLTMIILAPGVMAAACYMAMGRIIFWVTPENHRNFRTLWVPARFITPTFVTFDIFSFGIQLVGASIIASADITDFDRANKGSNIVEIGLGIQLVCFGFFSFVAARFIFVSGQFKDTWPSGNWLTFLYAINAACALILARSIYRMTEFATGREGYIKTYEWPFYVFDSLLIFFVIVVFSIFHPANYLPNLGLSKVIIDDVEARDYNGYELKVQN